MVIKLCFFQYRLPEFPDLHSRYKFLSLQIEMKRLITKVFAALLVIWYLVGVIGFGVHTCSGSGRSFVVSFVEGTACADIHSEDMCGPSSCCSHDHCSDACCGHVVEHHQGHSSLSTNPCCTNEYQMLELTGMVVDDDTREDFQSFRICGPVVTPDLCASESSVLCRSIIRQIHEPDSGVARACDSQALLSVWRI